MRTWKVTSCAAVCAMAALLTQCERVPTGHVPTTSAAVVQRMRADLVAKHFAIWDCGSDIQILRFNNMITTLEGKNNLPDFHWALGTTESGDAVVLGNTTVLQGGNFEHHLGEVLVVDKNRNLLRTLQTGCEGVYMLSRNLKRVACDQDGVLAWNDLGSGKWIPIAQGIPEDTEDNYAWSPRADRLAYDKGGKLYIYDTASRRSALLADGTDATWSPDGAWIAYHHGDDIRLISPEGEASRTLIPRALESNGQRLEWSPDSQYILTVYLSDQPRSWLPTIDLSVRVEVVRISDGAELLVDRMLRHARYKLLWIKE
ncbi:MAG: hypothetical protein ABSG25_07170 [Bryobacteraceae bacterium]